MNSMTHLDISYNQLTTLPKFLQKMGSLKEIRISPNKYVCSCELKWLWKWKSNPTVPDWRMTSCKMDSGETIIIFDINERAMGCIENRSTAYQLLAMIAIGNVTCYSFLLFYIVHNFFFEIDIYIYLLI